MFIASINDDGTGLVASFEGPSVAVVCHRESDTGAWEPLYGVKGTEQIPLPHCFELAPEAATALDMAFAAQGGGDA